MKQLALLLLQLTFIIFLDSSVSAQIKPAAAQIPDEVMNAEFGSVTDSAPIRLGTDKGSVLVVTVWASWCGPCRLAVAALDGVKKDFESRGLKVVGLTTEDPAKDSNEVRSFLTESKVDFPVAWINAAHAKILMGSRDAIPQILVLVDGTVVKRFVGWNPEHTMPQLREAVEVALTKGAPQ